MEIPFHGLEFHWPWHIEWLDLLKPITNMLGCFIVPRVFIFTFIVIFPISYVPQVNLNKKY